MKIEIQGLGNFELIPISAEKPEFPKVTKEGKPLTHKREGAVTYSWRDEEGNTYKDSEVFVQIGKQLIPTTKKIARTEKISTFELVDKADIISDFMSKKYFVVDVDNLTSETWDRKVKDKAVFLKGVKFSTNGYNWDTTYILKFQDSFIAIAGYGFISNAIREFGKTKGRKKKTDEIKISADVVEEEILAVM